MRPKIELIKYEMLEVSYLKSITHLSYMPDQIEFLFADGTELKITINELAYTLQDFIISKQIDRNVFNEFQKFFPEVLTVVPVFPENTADNLFHLLSEARRMQVINRIKEIDSLISPDIKSLFEKAQLLIFSGQYSSGRELALYLKCHESITDEVNKEVDKLLVMLEKKATPFDNTAENSPLIEASFFSPEQSIHKIGGLKWLFKPAEEKYTAIISFPQGGQECISVCSDMKQKIQQCRSIQDLIHILQTGDDETYNMATILEACYLPDSGYVPF